MELFDIYLKILLHFQELEKENKADTSEAGASFRRKDDHELYGIFRIHLRQEKDSIKNEILESLCNDQILLKTNLESIYFYYLDVFVHIFVDVYQLWIEFQKTNQIPLNQKLNLSYCVNHALKWVDRYEEYSHRYFVKEAKKICEKYEISNDKDIHSFLEKASMREIICFFVDCEEDDPVRKRYPKEKSTIYDIQNVIDMITEIKYKI